MIHESTLVRLETQLDVITLLLRGATPQMMIARAPGGEWSPHETLAHLARQQAIFLERLQRIMVEDAPQLNRYRAEEDSTWSEWKSLTTNEVIGRLNTQRVEILQFIKGLSDAEASRVGIHPLLGPMDLGSWAEFFVLHEAHHLYKLMIGLAEVKRAQAHPGR